MVRHTSVPKERSMGSNTFFEAARKKNVLRRTSLSNCPDGLKIMGFIKKPDRYFLIWKIWANASASYIIWVCDKRKLRISSENRFGKILATLEKIKRLWPLSEVWLSIWQNFVSTLANIFMLSGNFSWFLMAKHRLNNLAIWSHCILFVLCFAKVIHLIGEK